jgi:hypothetical protein
VQAAEPPAEARAPNLAGSGPQQDVVVAPPKRTASLSRLASPAAAAAAADAPPGWSQMGQWGLGGLVGQPPQQAQQQQRPQPTTVAPAPAPAQDTAYNPFGDNPLQRALAADYRRDPVVAQPGRQKAAAPTAAAAPPGGGGNAAAARSRADADAEELAAQLAAAALPPAGPPPPPARQDSGASAAAFHSYGSQGSLPSAALRAGSIGLPAPAAKLPQQQQFSAPFAAGLGAQPLSSQAAQWNAVQGLLRGLSQQSRAMSAEGLNNSSLGMPGLHGGLVSAASQGQLGGKGGWAAAQQQQQPSRPYTPLQVPTLAASLPLLLMRRPACRCRDWGLRK